MWRSSGPGNPGRACGHLMCALCLETRGGNHCGCLWNHNNYTEPPGAVGLDTTREPLSIEEVPADIGELVHASPCKKQKVQDILDLAPVKGAKQVYNQLKGRLHLACPRVMSSEKSDYTVCSKWRCGTVDNPSRNAEFYDRFDTITLCASSFHPLFQPCGSCFSSRVRSKR